MPRRRLPSPSSSPGAKAELARRRHHAARRLQLQYRTLLARRAAASARRLLIDSPLLWRLAALCARVERRAASLIQWRWRALRKSSEFHTRIALKRITQGVLRHQANRAAAALQRRFQQEQAEVAAATRLQCALRQLVARRRTEHAARIRAVGLL